MYDIPTSLYESAEIDGASLLQMIVRITLPSILPTIMILLILPGGTFINVGIEKILLMYSPLTYEVADQRRRSEGGDGRPGGLPRCAEAVDQKRLRRAAAADVAKRVCLIVEFVGVLLRDCGRTHDVWPSRPEDGDPSAE